MSPCQSPVNRPIASLMNANHCILGWGTLLLGSRATTGAVQCHIFTGRTHIIRCHLGAGSCLEWKEHSRLAENYLSIPQTFAPPHVYVGRRWSVILTNTTLQFHTQFLQEGDKHTTHRCMHGTYDCNGALFKYGMVPALYEKAQAPEND